MDARAGIIVAAGAGARLEAGGPKAFAPLGGEPLIVHAVRAFAACDGISGLVVVVGAGLVDQAERALAAAGLRPSAVCEGGATRAQSVRRGLDACPPGAAIVAVHDAARPLVSTALVAAAVEALIPPWDAVAPGLPVVDTLKLAQPGDQAVLRTLDRRDLWAVQTPQVFSRSTLEAVHARASADSHATDDLALVEEAGGRVRLIMGERENFKITYPEDLRLAEALLAARAGGAELA